MMAESVGIKRPMPTASNVANPPGTIEIWPYARSVLNTLLKISQRVGKDDTQAHTIDGITNMTACTKIMATKPPLESPIKRITPISKVLVSVVIIKSEYISKIEITTNNIITMLKTRPRNKSPKL